MVAVELGLHFSAQTSARGAPVRLQAVESECGAGGCRSNISVPAPFVWRCLTGSTLAPFPHPAHRWGRGLARRFRPMPCHVSSPLHVERSVRISRTALPHLLHAEVYGTWNWSNS